MTGLRSVGELLPDQAAGSYGMPKSQATYWLGCPNFACVYFRLVKSGVALEVGCAATFLRDPRGCRPGLGQGTEVTPCFLRPSFRLLHHER